MAKEQDTPLVLAMEEWAIVLRRGKGWLPAAHPIHLGGKKKGITNLVKTEE